MSLIVASVMSLLLIRVFSKRPMVKSKWEEECSYPYYGDDRLLREYELVFGRKK